MFVAAAVAARRVDDLQNLGDRGLSSERLVALGRLRIELPPKRSYGLAEISLRVVRHRLRLISTLTRDDTLPRPTLPARVCKRVRLQRELRVYEAWSEIDDDVACWLGAADQHIAIGRWPDRVGSIADSAEDESRLAAVADAGPARPSNRYIASFGEFEQAIKRRAPVDTEIASGERYQRTGTGQPVRQMRWPARNRSHTRRLGRAGAEDFGVDTAGNDPPRPRGRR